MYFKNYLERANLSVLQEFFKFGTEGRAENISETYETRIKEARKNALSFFEEKFKSVEEFDYVLASFEKQLQVYEEVYFEIGLLLGAKLGYEICEKMQQLK